MNRSSLFLIPLLASGCQTATINDKQIAFSVSLTVTETPATTSMTNSRDVVSISGVDGDGISHKYYMIVERQQRKLPSVGERCTFVGFERPFITERATLSLRDDVKYRVVFDAFCDTRSYRYGQ